MDGRTVYVAYVARLDSGMFPMPHNRADGADGQRVDLTDRLKTAGIKPKDGIVILVARVDRPDVAFTGTVNCFDGTHYNVGYWGPPGETLKQRGYKPEETVGVVVAKQ